MDKMKSRLLFLRAYFQKNTDEETTKTMKEILEVLAQNGYKADKRTVVQDIEVLNHFDMDIVAEKIGNVYYYYVASGIFEIAEIKLLIDVVQSSGLVSEKKAQKLIKKLESFTSENQASKLHQQSYFANRKNFATNEQVYYGIDAIYRAISEEKNIKFQYMEWVVEENEFRQIYHKDGYVYRVSPLTLFYNDNKYYLVCYDVEDSCIKNFRVDKMRFVEKLEESCVHNTITETFDTTEHTSELFGMYNGEKKRLQIYFPFYLSGVVVDRFGSKAHIAEHDEKGFVIEVDVQISSQFWSWLCGLGSDVRLLAPDDAIEALRKFLDSIRNIYTP